MMLHRALFVAAFMISSVCYGQAIDNTLSFKNINRHSYMRVNYENDFFSATDQYYTQGIHIELVAKEIEHFPITKALPHPKSNITRCGIALEHDGYTPSDISPPNILYGNHPYAACLFLKSFRISVDTVNRRRFSSSLSTGLIGQGAGGKEMQEGIHKWTHSLTPHGWGNQINNDLILNYQVNYEHQLIYIPHRFSFDFGGTAKIGTLSDKIMLGTTLLLGYFDNPYEIAITTCNNFRIYGYEHAEINFVGYDATLQGGVLNKTSPYTIAENDLNRIVFQNRLGIVIAYHGLYLEYFQSMHSSNFRTGDYHVWGGVQVATGL